MATAGEPKVQSLADQLHFYVGRLIMAGRGQLPLPEQLNRVVEAVKQLFERRAENLKFVEVNGYATFFDLLLPKAAQFAEWIRF